MPEFTEDIFFATIGELSAKLRAREFSCVELTRAFCDRLEKLGPRYNALALSLREDAMRQARKVDDDLRRKRFRGPLQGIPCGAKDLLAVAGSVTTWGARPFAAQVFDYNATVVNRLQRARAILIGKLSMVELAGGGGYRYASASLQGPGLNPWDRTRWSGGSSSGSGSAVAAALVPFAIGSETWGSIVTPCAYCGVTGLRPTYGYVSRYGAMALSWTMDKLGPMCRSAEDCGLVLQAIAGGDSNDPGSAGRGFYYAPQYVKKLSDIRVGYAPEDFEELAYPAARPAFAKALEVVRGLGVQLKEIRLPELPYSMVAGTVVGTEGSAIFEPLIRDGRVDQLEDRKQIAGLKAGLEVKASSYLKAMRVRRRMQDEARRLFGEVDAMLAPSLFGIASKITQALDDPSQPRPKPKPRGNRDLNTMGNLAGLPELILPCGFAEGMPVAVSLVTRPFNENLILQIGNQFQNVTEFHRQRPKV
ncbi:MAG: amidase [Bryobacteraceae bacterium]|nr:amidase [Bryobacterales bacterium]MEB2360903.1 amidase [Bryobacterales bacterium]NUN00834.1 amidase [Bryobacteraceae bacterium]